jgi:hypothetical protein
MRRLFKRKERNMATSNFYCMDYRALSNSTLVPSVSLTFAAGFEVDVSDHASQEPPAEFSPVIWYASFRTTDDYATFLASICPELPPSQSPVFSFCTRTYGGQHEFSNFNLPCGGVYLASLTDYLNYHFPALATSFEALGLLPATSRVGLLNALSQLIQPGVPAVTWGS